MLQYKKTPVQEIHHPVVEKAGVRLIVKREDLNHPHIAGNKWWKLKYNLAEVLQSRNKTILTFGGAFSNHIYATAAASSELKLKCIGIIRGEETLPLNHTLEFSLNKGMKIYYVSREAYRLKSTQPFIDSLQEKFGSFFLIPEGGSNALAVKGCAEFVESELAGIECDCIFLPVGTGGTMAGLICGFHNHKNIIGVSVLKNGNFLKGDIENLSKTYAGQTFQNWSLLTEYHHGGYAKVSSELVSFIKEMKQFHHLPLDHVYTGKLLWAIIKEIETGAFKRGSTILALHTGGLQGSDL